MNASLELTLYPFGQKNIEVIDQFIENLEKYHNINIETNILSTIITGEYSVLMDLLNTECKLVFEKSAASFVIKLSNTCGCNC